MVIQLKSSGLGRAAERVWETLFVYRESLLYLYPDWCVCTSARPAFATAYAHVPWGKKRFTPRCTNGQDAGVHGDLSDRQWCVRPVRPLRPPATGGNRPLSFVHCRLRPFALVASLK